MEADAVFEKLQAAFPSPSSPQASPILATGHAALERRSSSRRNSPFQDRHRDQTCSPALSDHVSSPISSDLRFRNADPLGLRSTASSPGPGQIDTSGVRKGKTPMPLTPLILKKTKKLRPSSELFLPTPVDPNKRMTVFKLPVTTPPIPMQSTLLNELFLPTPPQSAKHVSSINVPRTVLEEGDDNSEQSSEEEPMSPEGPPLSPISSAMARQRFSRLDVHDSVRHMVKNLNVITEHPFTFHSRAISTPIIERASTVPPTLQRTLSVATLKSFRSVPVRSGSIRPGGGRSRTPGGMRPLTEILKQRGARYSGIDKDVTAARRATALGSKLRSEIGPAAAAASPLSPLETEFPVRAANSVLPWRRKRRGETMSMLLDAGFFPVNEYIYNEKEEPVKPKRTPSKKTKALSIIIDDLPFRPSSIVGTPTEFYSRGLPGSPRRHIRGNPNRSLASKKRTIGQLNNRSPVTPRRTIIANALALSPLDSPTTPSTPSSAFFALTGSLTSPTSTPSRKSFTHSGSSTSPTSAQASPGILEVIPEDHDGDEDQAIQDRTPIIPHDPMILTEEPLDLLPNAPIKTEIHLSSGTVLTVCPPELTAWTRNTYIHGPIQLPAPTLAPRPRKDSIATLEPFQTAVDQIYDHVLQVPRRASEDQVMDDILEWYDDWGFEEPSFALDDFKENLDPDDDGPDGGKLWSAESPVSQQMVTRILDARARPTSTMSSNSASSSSSTSSPTNSTFPVSAYLSAPDVGHGSVSVQRNTAALSFNRTTALSPLPESPSTSPTSSRIDLSLPSSSSTTKALPALPPPAPPAPAVAIKHRVSQADMWGSDDEDEEEAPSRPSWLPGAHAHLEVKEIRGVRPVSTAVVRRESASTVGSGGKGRTGSVVSEGGVATKVVVRENKSKGGARRRVRRLVGIV